MSKLFVTSAWTRSFVVVMAVLSFVACGQQKSNNPAASSSTAAAAKAASAKNGNSSSSSSTSSASAASAMTSSDLLQGLQQWIKDSEKTTDQQTADANLSKSIGWIRNNSLVTPDADRKIEIVVRENDGKGGSVLTTLVGTLSKEDKDPSKDRIAHLAPDASDDKADKDLTAVFQCHDADETECGTSQIVLEKKGAHAGAILQKFQVDSKALSNLKISTPQLSDGDKAMPAVLDLQTRVQNLIDNKANAGDLGRVEVQLTDLDSGSHRLYVAMVFANESDSSGSQEISIGAQMALNQDGSAFTGQDQDVAKHMSSEDKANNILRKLQGNLSLASISTDAAARKSFSLTLTVKKDDKAKADQSLLISFDNSIAVKLAADAAKAKAAADAAKAATASAAGSAAPATK